MIIGNGDHPTGLATLVGRVGRVALRGLHSRLELLAVEWQEARLRLTQVLFLAAALLFLSTMGGLLLAATIIFLFPEGLRVYVMGAMAVLFLLGAVGIGLALRRGLKQEPFAESIGQVKKDRQWLESLE